MVYEKEAILKGMSSGEKIKLIDFAHVLEGKGMIDHNFLGGLCSLIKMISEILTSLDENPNRSCLQDYEKNHSYSLSGNCVSLKTKAFFMFWHGPFCQLNGISNSIEMSIDVGNLLRNF